MTDMSTVAVQGVAWLSFLAVVNTMPDDLPQSLRDVPKWLYGWVHTALKTFVSYRGPAK